MNVTGNGSCCAPPPLLDRESLDFVRLCKVVNLKPLRQTWVLQIPGYTSCTFRLDITGICLLKLYSEQVDDLIQIGCLQLRPPQTTSAFSKTQHLRWVGLQGILPGWNPVSNRQFSRWRLLHPHFLRSLLLSSLCLGCLEDVTWPILEKFLSSLFSKPCIVFYYRCLKIFLLCFFFLSPPLCHHHGVLSLSNKMSPHKMNKSKRIRVYQTSYQTFCFEQGHQKLFTTCCVLCSVSRSFCSHQLFLLLLEKHSKHLSHYQAAVVASLIQRAEHCQGWKLDS